MSGWHLGKKICLAALLFCMVLTGCSSQNGESGYNIYTEKNMNHFVSEKKAIPDLSSVDISCSYANIEVIASDGFYLEYSFYYVSEAPKLSTMDGMLFFDDSKMNQGTYSVSLKAQNYIKLYVPTSAKFEKFNLLTSSGNISAGSFTTEKLEVKNDYGDVILTNLMLKEGTVKLSSGSLKMEEIGAEKLELKNSYGDITLLNLNQGQYTKNADDRSLYVSMSSGNFDGTGLSFQKVQCTNNYGDMTLSAVTADTVEATLQSGDLFMNDISADNVDVDSSYGDVTMVMNGKEKDYNLNIHSAYGAVSIGSSKYEGNVKSDYQAEKDIEVTVSSGDVSLNFK